MPIRWVGLIGGEQVQSIRRSFVDGEALWQSQNENRQPRMALSAPGAESQDRGTLQAGPPDMPMPALRPSSRTQRARAKTQEVGTSILMAPYLGSIVRPQIVKDQRNADR